jgi:hypothetical protein
MASDYLLDAAQLQRCAQATCHIETFESLLDLRKLVDEIFVLEDTVVNLGC